MSMLTQNFKSEQSYQDEIAALRQEIDRLTQERDRLQHTVEEQRATITYLEGLRHE